MKCLVIAYMLVCGSPKDITTDVNAALSEGWQPVGGFGGAGAQWRDCQAMVKYECK